MRAALRSDSVQKIVLTSSEAAIAYGHPAAKVRFSSETLINIAEGKSSVMPEMTSHYVDVRDCARMHIAIMNNPGTDGQRHFSFSAKGTTSSLADIVRTNYAHLGFKVSSRKLPRFVLWLLKPFSSDVASIYSRVGRPAFYETKHPHVYRYEYKNLEQMVKDTMDSLLTHKLLVPPKAGR